MNSLIDLHVLEAVAVDVSKLLSSNAQTRGDGVGGGSAPTHRPSIHIAGMLGKENDVKGVPVKFGALGRSRRPLPKQA